MNTQHTPGPWAIEVPDNGQDGYPHNWMISHNSPSRAVYVANIPGAAHYARAQADAKLIAAAPDMLDGLVYILEILRSGKPVDAINDAHWIEMLIEKATGEQP